MDPQRPFPASVSVITCTLNEAGNVAHVLEKVPAWVDELIVVDGHSTDRTVEIVQSVAPHARVLHQSGKGKGDALRCGIAAARGDLIITMDADGSMDPSEISRYLTCLLEGCDFVKGSRFLPGGGTDDMPLYRVVANWFLTQLSNVLVGTRLTDISYGFYGFRGDALRAFQTVRNGFEMETELIMRFHLAGMRLAEVPSFEAARRYGVGKLRSFPDASKIMMTVLSFALSRWADKTRRVPRRLPSTKADTFAVSREDAMDMPVSVESGNGG